jgi:uncharacterized protein (TIGR00106 family)
MAGKMQVHSGRLYVLHSADFMLEVDANGHCLQLLLQRWSEKMKVLIDLCIVPLGVGVSLSSYIAACEKVLTGAGLTTALHSYGTNVEGEWDAVFAAVKRCHEVVHEMGAPRITTTIKLGTRTDRQQTMEDKVRSVQEKLGTAG